MMPLSSSNVTIPEPSICGPVQVNWLADGSVDRITYNGQSLREAVTRIMQPLQASTIPLAILFTPEQKTLIDNLLTSVSSLPARDEAGKVLLADKIFENLNLRESPENPPNPKLRSIVWKAILDQVWRWEDSQHKEIHKGTAYFFMAESYLEQGDVPSAYICLFNALKQDEQNCHSIGKNPKDRPTYLTTSLVDRADNAFYYSVVLPLRGMIHNFINGYNTRMSRTNGKLSIALLDKKFLQADLLEWIKRFFVPTVHEIYHLSFLNDTRMINNDYSKLKIIDTLFNLSLIIDQILEYRFLQTLPKKDRDMGKAVYQLALCIPWTTKAKDPDAGVFIKRVKPMLNNNSPDQVLPALLDGSATYDGVSMDWGMRAILGSYHLRNYAGHNIEGSNVLVERYQEILNLEMDAFFISIESL